jgi:hypothetical protein
MSSCLSGAPRAWDSISQELGSWVWGSCWPLRLREMWPAPWPFPRLPRRHSPQMTPGVGARLGGRRRRAGRLCHSRPLRPLGIPIELFLMCFNFHFLLLENTDGDLLPPRTLSEAPAGRELSSRNMLPLLGTGISHQALLLCWGSVSPSVKGPS